MPSKALPILLVLLVAFGLRAYQLTAVPPGLTHDEANHGRDALNVLDGVLLFYFPLNYGSEPLYNYTVAGQMVLTGENLLSLRLVNATCGLLAIAVTYAWARRAIGRPVALLAGALMAISFWPVVASRFALRAGMLPLLTAAAGCYFWTIVDGGRRTKDEGQMFSVLRPSSFVGFALAVALALHTYLAARAWWLLFPLFLLYLAAVHRPLFRRVWRPTLLGLLTAGLLTAPMFLYVRAHPEADTRLAMLDGPLQALAQGNLVPILRNAGEGLLAFFWPGHGDHFLAYNVPGRPIWDPLTAALSLVGLLVCLTDWRRPAYAFILLWFSVGILPSLLTGPEANTTRNLAALAPTYLLPAVGLAWSGKRLTGIRGLGDAQKDEFRRMKDEGKRSFILHPSSFILIAFIGFFTGRDYFIRWGQSPDVRAAYQHTLVEALAYLEREAPAGPVVISSLYPGAAHDPSLARVLLARDDLDWRWVDGRRAMMWTAGQPALLVAPSSTPLHPALSPLTQPVTTISLRPDDLDPTFTVYRLKEMPWPWLPDPVHFGPALDLVAAHWLASPVNPGQTAELLTVWRVLDPAQVGPIVPPAFTTEVVFFTHLLDAAGQIVAQDDALHAPSWDWQKGDLVVQIHQLVIPVSATPGRYPAAVGVYDRLSGDRLPALDGQGQVVESRAFVSALEIVGP